MLPTSFPAEDQASVDQVFSFLTFRHPVFLACVWRSVCIRTPWGLLGCRLMARPQPHHVSVLIILLCKACDKALNLTYECTPDAQPADGRGQDGDQLSAEPWQAKLQKASQPWLGPVRGCYVQHLAGGQAG